MRAGLLFLAVFAFAVMPAMAASVGQYVPQTQPTQAERQAELLIAQGIGAARAGQAPDAPKLGSDDALVDIARLRSQAMAGGAPLSHVDAKGRFIAGDMMQAHYGPKGAFGENIGEAYDSRGFDPQGFAKQMVEGWMNSPGHRKNILSPDFTMSGIGVAVRDGHAFVTQVFYGPGASAPAKISAKPKS